LKAIGYKNIIGRDFIKVDPSKRYRLSGCFKSVGEGGLSKVYFGYRPYDKLFREINEYMPSHLTNTKTTLTQQLNPGDNVVYLNSAINYTSGFLSIFPFEDYPEYTYTRNYYQYGAVNYDNNSLTLSAPYNGAILPIGTKVAKAHSGCGSYMYSTLSNQLIPNDWNCYSGEIYGQYVPGVSCKQFRYGTQYIKFSVLASYSQDATYSLLADDLKFELIANE